MKRSFESIAGSRKLVAAGLAASILLAVVVVQQTIGSVLDFGLFLAQGSGMESMPWSMPSLLSFYAVGVVGFAAGFFLCLWLFAPIAAELRLSSVVGRSLLALVGGAVILFVITLLQSLFSGFDESAGRVFGWAYGALATASTDFGWAATQAIYSSISTASAFAPPAVLAGVMVWLWLRANPAKTPKTAPATKV